MGSVNDVLITPLQKIEALGGDVIHAMKSTDIGFNGFGEAYFSWVSSGSIKAWKRHNIMTMNLVVPVGNVRFVFFSMDDCKYRVEEIGSYHYARLTVPPGIWFGFKGLSSSSSLVLNMSSIVHNPDEVSRLSLSDIEYSWE
jgi:dTDP-4-dehydrorhamnose 3,5-epimerase